MARKQNMLCTNDHLGLLNQPMVKTKQKRADDTITFAILAFLIALHSLSFLVIFRALASDGKCH